jgi:hypothetical protein
MVLPHTIKKFYPSYPKYHGGGNHPPHSFSTIVYKFSNFLYKITMLFYRDNVVLHFDTKFFVLSEPEVIFFVITL